MNAITNHKGNDIMKHNRIPFDSLFYMAEEFLKKEFSSDFLYNEYLSRSEITGNDSEYTLKVTVPGCGPEDVDVFVEGQTLRVKSKKQRFEKKYDIPRDVDRDRIAAAVKHGLLDVTLPKLVEDKPKSRKISVR